jgi:hypothetical protein
MFLHFDDVDFQYIYIFVASILKEVGHAFEVAPVESNLRQHHVIYYMPLNYMALNGSNLMVLLH